MSKHPYKKSKQELLQKQVVILYKAGNSFRTIANLLKISHETVRQVWLSVSVDKLA